MVSNKLLPGTDQLALTLQALKIQVLTSQWSWHRSSLTQTYMVEMALKSCVRIIEVGCAEVPRKNQEVEILLYLSKGPRLGWVVWQSH